MRDAEKELYKDYLARCARIITENTAKMAQGSYLPYDFSDIISGETTTSSEDGTKLTERIKNKLSGKEDDS